MTARESYPIGREAATRQQNRTAKENNSYTARALRAVVD